MWKFATLRGLAGLVPALGGSHLSHGDEIAPASRRHTGFRGLLARVPGHVVIHFVEAVAEFLLGRRHGLDFCHDGLEVLAHVVGRLHEDDEG